MYMAEAVMSIFLDVSDEISAEKSMASMAGVKPACLPTAWIRSIMNPCIWCVAGSRNENGTPLVSVPTFITVCAAAGARSEEHTSELPSLMRHSYAVFCLKKQKTHIT